MRKYLATLVIVLFAATSLFACSKKAETPAPAPAVVAPAPAPVEVKKEEVKKPEAKPVVKTDKAKATKEVKKTK